jgi:hypothetical protein
MDSFLCFVKDYGTLIAIVVGIIQYMRTSNWNKRVYAKQAVERLDNNLSVQFLHQLARSDGKTNNDTVSVSEFENLEKDDQLHVYEALNCYEGIASGVNEKLYNENIVKKDRGSSVVKIFKSYEPIIKYRRDETKIDTLYTEFQKLALKWS